MNKPQLSVITTSPVEQPSKTGMLAGGHGLAMLVASPDLPPRATPDLVQRMMSCSQAFRAQRCETEAEIAAVAKAAEYLSAPALRKWVARCGSLPRSVPAPGLKARRTRPRSALPAFVPPILHLSCALSARSTRPMEGTPVSEKIITIHKTPHVAWQGTEAAAAALGLFVGAHKANANGTKNGVVLKTNADAPKPVHTHSQNAGQAHKDAGKSLGDGNTLPSMAAHPIPQPFTSFEDTTHAWEEGYRAGRAATQQIQEQGN